MKYVKCTTEDGFKFLPPQAPIDRTDGLHLTNILQDIMISSGMMKDNGPFRPNMYAETGFIWEDLIAMVLRERLPNRIGEIELDGVSMSPDGFDFEKWELWEYKATWMSMNKLAVDNWRWMAQVKAYCKAMDTKICKLWVLYMNGDYRGSGPTPMLYKIEFTQMELDENWDMVVQHAKHKGWVK